MASQHTLANTHMKTPDRPKHNKMPEPSPTGTLSGFPANLPPLSTPHRPGAPSFLDHPSFPFFDSPGPHYGRGGLLSPGGDFLSLLSPLPTKESRFASEGLGVQLPFTTDQVPFTSPPLFKAEPIVSPKGMNKLPMRQMLSPSKALTSASLEAHPPRLGALSDVLYSDYAVNRTPPGSLLKDADPLLNPWELDSPFGVTGLTPNDKLHSTPALETSAAPKRTAKRKLLVESVAPDQMADIQVAVQSNIFSAATESLGTENQSPTLAPTTGSQGPHRAAQSGSQIHRDPSFQCYADLHPDPPLQLLEQQRSLQERPSSQQRQIPRLELGPAPNAPLASLFQDDASQPLLETSNRTSHVPGLQLSGLQAVDDIGAASQRLAPAALAPPLCLPRIEPLLSPSMQQQLPPEQRVRPAHLSLAVEAARMNSGCLPPLDRRNSGSMRRLQSPALGPEALGPQQGAPHMAPAAVGPTSSYHTEGGSSHRHDAVSEGNYAGSQGGHRQPAAHLPQALWDFSMPHTNADGSRELSSMREYSHSVGHDYQSPMCGGPDKDLESREARLQSKGVEPTLDAQWGGFEAVPPPGIQVKVEPTCSGRASAGAQLGACFMGPGRQIKAEPRLVAVSSALAAPTAPRTRTTKPRERPILGVPFPSTPLDPPTLDTPALAFDDEGIGKRLPPRNRGTLNPRPNKLGIPLRCNCKRSRCLKLYCDCFADGTYCGISCTCQQCMNTENNRDLVAEKRSSIKQRNPQAFQKKITTASDGSTMTRGCNCKKSRCKKGYCECFQAGVPCGEHCRCCECENPRGYVTQEEGFTADPYFGAAFPPPPANMPPPLTPSSMARFAAMGSSELQKDN